MQAYSKLDTLNKKMYDKPTKYTMTERKNYVKCKCGHSVEFWHGENRVLCNWCNQFVYRTPALEFKYKLKERLRKK